MKLSSKQYCQNSNVGELRYGSCTHSRPHGERGYVNSASACEAVLSLALSYGKPRTVSTILAML